MSVNRSGGMPSAAAAFDPEIMVEAFAPILKEAIAQATALMPRIARQATYQTIPIAAGQTLDILGFDATRQSFVVAGSAIGLWMGEQASINSSGSATAASPSIPVPTFPAYFEFQHQAPVRVFNSTGAPLLVYVSVMSHGIA